MKINKLTLTGVLGTVAAALVLSAGPASADPDLGTYPTLAGTGSDTTQFVLGGLGDVIPAIGSWDALPAGSTIHTRSGGQEFNRPNGSSAGVRALSASINPGGNRTYPLTVNGVTSQVSIAGQLDFARSSSGPSVAGTDLTYIPFALDAVTYAYSDLHGDASVPGILTRDDLNAIYRKAVTTYVGADGLTHTYKPLLPQANSGTRQFFLQQIGLTESQVAGIPTVQENDGSQIDAVGEIVPFSAASWIAQDNTAIPNTIGDNSVVLGALDDDLLGVVYPREGGQLNPSFPFSRNVYNVVQTSRLSAASASPADKVLQNTFETIKPSGSNPGRVADVCAASSTIAHYGFAPIANCGDVTTYRSGFMF